MALELETRTVHADGSYEVATWLDENGSPTDRRVAAKCEIQRYDAAGEVIDRTYATLSGTTNDPPAEDSEPVVYTPGSDPERFGADGDDVEWLPPGEYE